MNENDVLAWDEMVKRVARNVARDFPDTEREDLEQDLWLELILAEQKAVDKGIGFTPEGRHSESALYYAAKELAVKTRKQHLTISTQYAYRTSDVRALLKTFFSKEEWLEANTPEDAISELGSVGMEMSSDLSRAWDLLYISHKVVIFRYFGLHEKVDTKKLSSAISRMADILNQYQPARRAGVGTRKIISSATAKYITDRDREGEPRFPGPGAERK